MIRGIDITQLLTTGDQSGLRQKLNKSRHAIGDDTYRKQQINSALTADSGADIDTDKADRAKDFIATTMDTVYSRNLLRDGKAPSSRIREKEGYVATVERLSQFMTNNIMGLARASLICDAQILGVKSKNLLCDGLIGNGTPSIVCDASIVPSAKFQLSAAFSCEATVQTATFQVIDFRWGDDVAENPFKNPADPLSFANDNIEYSTGVYLAVRFRLSGNIALTGNDWEIYYLVDAAGGADVDVDWTEITTTSDIFRIQTPTSGRLKSISPLNKANSVTRPGPGNPDLHSQIIIAQVGAQSPARSAGSVTSNTEVEVWFPLFLKDPGYATSALTKIFFKFESSTLTTTGLNVVAGNATTDAHWWQAPIT